MKLEEAAFQSFHYLIEKKMPGFNVCIFVSIAFLVAVKNYLMEDFKKEGFVLAHNLRGQSS